MAGSSENYKPHRVDILAFLAPYFCRKDPAKLTIICRQRIITNAWPRKRQLWPSKPFGSRPGCPSTSEPQLELLRKQIDGSFCAHGDGYYVVTPIVSDLSKARGLRQSSTKGVTEARRSGPGFSNIPQ
jgi:hypothetical protein